MGGRSEVEQVRQAEARRLQLAERADPDRPLEEPFWTSSQEQRRRQRQGLLEGHATADGPGQDAPHPPRRQDALKELRERSAAALVLPGRSSRSAKRRLSR